MSQLDLDEQIARIRRTQAETDKLFDESSKLSAEFMKLQAEALKFQRESMKLQAEGLKFQRERTTLVLTAGAAILGAGGVIGGLLVKLLP